MYLRNLLKMTSVAILVSLSPLANAQAPQWHPSDSDLAQLAQRFRPYLKFSTGDRQESRPMTWQNLYNSAALMNGKATVLAVGGLAGTNAANALNYADITKDATAAQNYTIVVDDQAQYGEDWPAVEQGDGLYAHVIWLKDVTNTPTSPELVNIEYYLLFGLNVGYVPAEDHKGDLIGVEVVYDHASDKLVRATFSEHGKTLIMFDLSNAQTPENATITGKDENGKAISEAACKISVSDHDYYSGGLSGGPGIFTGGDKHVFMTHDPTTNRCEHLAVYIEHGSHEPWPNQSGYYIGVASHNGDDVSFLPQSVHVLGPGDNPFVLFGGNYGDPAGMMRHRMWLGYNRNANPADQDPYVDRGSLKWLPVVNP
jgi:hypothetical protein